METIKYIKDRRGRKRYPVTHEKGVRDSEHTTLEEKMKDVLQRLSALEEIVFSDGETQDDTEPANTDEVQGQEE